MDNHKVSYHIAQGTLLHVMCGSLDGRSVGENGYKRVHGEALWGPPGGITSLTSYIPIQKLKIKRRPAHLWPQVDREQEHLLLVSSPCVVTRPQKGLINIY